MKVIRFLSKFIPTILVGITILYLSLSHVTSPYNVPNIQNLDKIVHFTMYMGLVSVFCFDVYRSRWLSRYDGSILLSGWILAVLWGGLMELFQKYFTEYRTADWFDFLANTVGAFAGILIGVFIIRPLIRRYKKTNKRQNAPIL